MAGMTIDKAMRYLKRKLDATASKTIAIVVFGPEGNEAIEEIDAVPVRSNFQDYATDEFASSAEEFDWILQADRLIFPSGKKQPADGWELRYVLDDGRTAVYVARPNAGGRCFSNEDALGILVCVHTKLERIDG